MPDWNTEIIRRLAKLNLEPTRETSIVEELAQNLDDCHAALLANGANEAEAYRQTLLEMSGSEFLMRELPSIERESKTRTPHSRNQSKEQYDRRPLAGLTGWRANVGEAARFHAE